MEQWTGSKHGCDLLEILRVIRSEIDFASRGQGLVSQGGKALVDEPMTAVLAFGPRIGKVDMNRQS